MIVVLLEGEVERLWSADMLTHSKRETGVDAAISKIKEETGLFTV